MSSVRFTRDMPVSLLRVIVDTCDERERQDARWGQQNHDPLVWNAILGEEVGEATKEALEARFTDDLGLYKERLNNLRTELVQVAAVAVAFIECLDRGTWQWGS